MKSRILGLLVFALISANAMAQTLVGTTTDPLGIDGLVVEGTTYNVTFSTTTFDSPFTQGSTASVDAALAIASALGSLGVTELAGSAPVFQCPPMTGCQYSSILFIAVDNAPTGPNDAALCSNSQSILLCSQHSWGLFQVEIADNIFGSVPRLGPLDFGGYGYAADFTKVPEPTTLSLLGLGLAGVGLMRWRKRN